jgi:hypothetical protein
MIAVLAALLLPALSSSKEHARRAGCLNNIRQFILATHLYAHDNEDQLPSGKSEYRNPEDSHIPVISTATRSNIIAFGGSPKILECPKLGKPYEGTGGWFYRDYGYVIGYNYLGGHQNTPWPKFREFAGWKSPQRLTDDSVLVLVTDINDWSPGYGKAFAPHGRAGAILIDDTSSSANPDLSSKDVGAKGGNVGYLDGSASWKPIDQMKPYRGSRLWGSGGCFALW